MNSSFDFVFVAPGSPNDPGNRGIAAGLNDAGEKLGLRWASEQRPGWGVTAYRVQGDPNAKRRVNTWLTPLLDKPVTMTIGGSYCQSVASWLVGSGAQMVTREGDRYHVTSTLRNLAPILQVLDNFAKNAATQPVNIRSAAIHPNGGKAGKGSMEKPGIYFVGWYGDTLREAGGQGRVVNSLVMS